MSEAKECMECRATESSRFRLLTGNKWKKAEAYDLLKVTWEKNNYLCHSCYMNCVENQLRRLKKEAKWPKVSVEEAETNVDVVETDVVEVEDVEEVDVAKTDVVEVEDVKELDVIEEVDVVEDLVEDDDVIEADIEDIIKKEMENKIKENMESRDTEATIREGVEAINKEEVSMINLIEVIKLMAKIFY